MKYSGPIDLESLVDLNGRCPDGLGHWTFFAFPKSMVDEHGLPGDDDAQRYIAAIQATGVPVGIWLNSPVKGTGYAAVSGEHVDLLKEVIVQLDSYGEGYASELSERLFRDVDSA